MSKKTILAVDDSLTMRKLTESTLRQAGYEVILASTGGEGFKIALERRPNLVLLDYILPDMRGVEFCQQLQEAEIDHTIPILLISGHGNAIRELYQDFPNVVDYLTKPFAANVLLAVVSNILGKVEKPADEAPAPAPLLDTTAVTLPAAIAPVPDEVAPVPAELRQRVFQKLVSHLHPPLTSIPSLEEARHGQAPSSYYLTRLLPLELIDELARELVALGSGQMERDEEPIRCPSKFASERHLMTYLSAERATGRLAMKLREETISLYFDHGTIVSITCNNPRAYCAGSTYPFAQVARTLISQAMAAQRDSSTPFFITLEAGGFQNSGVSLPDLLRDCGHRCLARATDEKSSLLNFTTMPVLPAFVNDYRVEYVLNQILLESYRRVRDWQHISAYVPSLDYFVSITEHGPEQIAQLTFSGLEAELLERINGDLTIQELIDQSGQPVFEVCHALFCLIRLDLAYLSTAAQSVPADESEIPEEALVESASA
jgi:two-component system phosphate regulon response regulator PhoB